MLAVYIGFVNSPVFYVPSKHHRDPEGRSHNMLNRIRNLFLDNRSLQKINYALSRGAASSALRSVDLVSPQSWEFSGFSQNGEDGILEVLLKNILQPNRYFIEIGTADGLENNTSWLSIVHRYSGLCIEGNPDKSALHKRVFLPLNYGLSFQNLFVTRETASQLTDLTQSLTPDIFSLDIDGIDWHVAVSVLDAGFRPRVFVVEYNSAFGPNEPLTIPYQPDFRIGDKPADRLYYGSALAAWRRLFENRGYQFVTVDRNGVNAFFVHRQDFHESFLNQISGLQFAENFSQRKDHPTGWRDQFSLIQHRNFIVVNPNENI